jgi:2-polyprenyl-3-methyl-5-hydroxy-6-metoxy-1,4-benzoquinol methylase
MIEHWREVLQKLPTERVNRCVVCTDSVGIEDLRFKSLLMLCDPYSVQRCPSCGLHWLSPRPNAEGYRRLYSQESYFGGSGASPAQYEAVVTDRLDYFRSRIQRAARILQRSTPLSVLDYGAATGDFVALARAEGHHCEGVELSDDARAASLERLGISLLSSEQAESLKPGQFDLLHMNHVLEHMPNPAEHLRWCANLLKPDGLLVFEIPQQFDNDLDRMRRLLHCGGRQLRFDAYSLHHTYFFNPKTVRLLLQRNGFEPLHLSTFNADKTPLWPPRARSWVLFFLLGMADKLHRGGNIVEVFARRTVGM